MIGLFQLPTKIVFGAGAIKNLVNEIENFSAHKVLLVSDPGVISAGITQKVEALLKKERGLTVSLFGEVEPDPSIGTAMSAARAAEDSGAEIMVAVGGGSAIDTAKSAAILVGSTAGLKSYAGVNKVKTSGLPVLAVPTTAGTGSEVTVFAVMSDPENNEKFTISSPLISPRVALLDPELTLSLPPGITAATGMDALTHAIEAYTSVLAQPATDALAIKAIELISGNLRIAVGRGDNLEARQNMLQASLLAGIAFNNAFLGLSHAIASPLGGYFHIAHGLANAIMLPYVMEYNLPTAPAKLTAIAKAMGISGVGPTPRAMAAQAVLAVKELCRDIGIPEKLREAGARAEELPAVAADALKSVQLKFNARIAGENEILALLKKAF